jgi:hypothetical protein
LRSAGRSGTKYFTEGNHGMRRTDSENELRRMKEADWKIFRELRALALERFCERVLSEVRDLSAKSGSSYERYLEIYSLLQKRDKKIAAGFDDMSRSRMDDHLLVICSLDLLTPDEIARFSDVTRKMLERWTREKARR